MFWGKRTGLKMVQRLERCVVWFSRNAYDKFGSVSRSLRKESRFWRTELRSKRSRTSFAEM